MGQMQYHVHTVRDDPVRLGLELSDIKAAKGRVISIIWQPARLVTPEPCLPTYEVASGYVVVSECEVPEGEG